MDEKRPHYPRQISRSNLRSFLLTLFLLLNYILLRSRIESKSYIQYSNSQEKSTKQRQSKLNGGAREPLHPIKAAKIFFSHTIHTESKKKQSQKMNFFAIFTLLLTLVEAASFSRSMPKTRCLYSYPKLKCFQTVNGRMKSFTINSRRPKKHHRLHTIYF